MRPSSRDSVPARRLMSRPVRRLTSRASVRDAAAFLTRHGISGAPVEDEHGRWVGVFSMSDLARSVASRLASPPDRTLEAREPVRDDPARTVDALASLPIVELMTPGMVTVFPESTIDEVLRAMLSFQVHRVFVIDEASGELEGVITTMDVVRWLESARDPATTVRKAR